MAGCPRARQLRDYLAGELHEADSDELEAHVETCTACLDSLARLTAAPDLESLWCPPPAEVPTPQSRGFLATPPPYLDESEPVAGEPAAGENGPGQLPELPGYEILRELGRGGRGVVYLAREQRLKRLVAVKMILHRAQASADDLARFQSEAQALASLNHPNLVLVHVVDEHAGVPFFVMEYVPGGSLRQHVAGQRLSHTEAVTIVVRLAEAMASVHAAGIVHRDLKPDNVLMAAKGEPKVSDFGLARQADWADERITQTGAVLGTPLYMAPEQAAGRGQEIGPTADVYSLGAILYELLTGVPPIQGSGVVELLAEILLREPVAPRRLVPSIPRDLETICLKCLRKEPARRYANAQALADDMQRFLADKPILARPPSRWYQLRKFAQRHRALVGGTAATACSLVLGLALTILFAVGEARQRGHAERHARAATVAKREAEFQAERARQQRHRAEDNAQIALAEKREAELQSYRARMSAAVLALASNDVADSKRNLDECPRELRGWEWRHLYSRLDESASTTPAPTGSGLFVFGAPDPLRFGTFTQTGVSITNLESGGHETLPIGPARGQRVTVAQTRLGLRAAVWVGPKAFELLDENGHVLCRAEVPGENRRKPIAISPDGRWLVCSWEEGRWERLGVYDACSGAQTAICEGHEGPVWVNAFSPDGTRFASTGDRIVRVWDPVTGSLLAACEGHQGRVYGVNFSPDGKRVVTASSDGTVRQWDSATGREVETAYSRHSGTVAEATYSPCGRWIASVGFDRTVRLWRAEGREDVVTWHGHTGPVVRVAFAPDGRRLATASSSWVFSPGKDTVAVWDVSPESPLPAVKGHGGSVHVVAFSPNHRWIATGSEDETARLWDAATGQCCATLPHPGAVRSLAFGPDGTWLVTVNHGDGLLRIWDVATARLRKEIPGTFPDNRKIIASSDGKQLAATVFNGTTYRFQICDVATGEWIFSAEGMVLAYSLDGRWLAAAEVSDKAVLLLDAQSHETVARFEGHTGMPWTAAFSPDSCCLATGSRDHTVRLWQIENGDCRVLRGHSGDVYAVAFHPDGSRLATAGLDGAVWLWDVARGQEVARLPGHESHVKSLAFSPDGATLASGSGDTTLRLWDTVPLRERYQARRDVEAVQPEAARLVARLSAELGSATDVASRVQTDDSLSSVLRRAALRELMAKGGQ